MKTKQKDKLINLLERIISSYPDFTDVNEWHVRLSKLKSKNTDNDTELKPSDINTQYASNPTLGKRLQLFKDSLPKFNFYYNMPEGMQTLEYLRFNNPCPFEKSAELRKHKDEIETLISEAKIAENDNNIKKAIEIYEKLIVEEYEGKQPYERLMILYRRLKWFDEEKRIIQHAISFFSQLKENQLKKVVSLAKEYSMESKALEYINKNKKIFYYGGAFELYNPFPIIKKWEERLAKMK